MRKMLACTVAAVALLAACGTEIDAEHAASSADDSEDVAADGDLPLTTHCGAVVFPGGVVDLAAFTGVDDDTAAIIESVAILAAPEWPDATWSVASRSQDEIVLFGQGSSWSEEGYVDATLELREGAWAPTGWGGCNIEIEAPGYNIAQFTIARAHQPSPDATSLTLQATERACASGKGPEDRPILVQVVESDEFVDVRVFVDQGSALANTCPTNPSFPVVVELAAPLGDRTVRDLWTTPPVIVPTVVEPPAGRVFVDVAGTAPTAGTANVFGWMTLDYQGALLLTSFVEWGNQPTWIQGFDGQSVSVISGWVTPCDNCTEECEGGACDDLERLGAECVLDYVHEPTTDARVTITYNGAECEIDVVREPAVDPS